MVQFHQMLHFNPKLRADNFTYGHGLGFSGGDALSALKYSDSEASPSTSLSPAALFRPASTATASTCTPKASKAFRANHRTSISWSSRSLRSELTIFSLRSSSV